MESMKFTQRPVFVFRCAWHKYAHRLSRNYGYSPHKSRHMWERYVTKNQIAQSFSFLSDNFMGMGIGTRLWFAVRPMMTAVNIDLPRRSTAISNAQDSRHSVRP